MGWAMPRVLCEAILARLARFLIILLQSSLLRMFVYGGIAKRCGPLRSQEGFPSSGMTPLTGVPCAYASPRNTLGLTSSRPAFLLPLGMATDVTILPPKITAKAKSFKVL